MRIPQDRTDLEAHQGDRAMKRIVFVITFLVSVGILAAVVKSKEDKSFPKPKFKISRGESIMIEQFLGKKKKAKQESPGVILTLVCLDKKKKKGSYSCETIDLKAIAK